MSKNDVTLLDRISAIMSEIGAGETKEAKTTDTSVGGTSSHPTVNAESGEEAATEGAQTADNTQYVKKHTPGSPDATPDATPGSETTQDEVQPGTALPTGEWPKDTPDDRPDDVATSHPADASVGPKYSEDLSSTDLSELLKAAQELGNELTAALATGFLTEDAPATPAAPAKPTKKANSEVNKAAEQGAEDAKKAAEAEDVLAAEVIESVVKSACDRADLAAGYLTGLLEQFSKEAVGVDPTSEDMLADDPAAGGEIDEATLAALLAALEGEGGAPMGEAPLGEPPLEEPVGDDAAAEELLAAMAGPGGAEEEVPLEAPDELAGMDDEAALLELLAALDETGEDEAALGKMGGDVGAYLAKSASVVRKGGKYKYSSAKKGSAQRKVRDYMKAYVNELYRRHR